MICTSFRHRGRWRDEVGGSKRAHSTHVTQAAAREVARRSEAELLAHGSEGGRGELTLTSISSGFSRVSRASLIPRRQLDENGAGLEGRGGRGERRALRSHEHVLSRGDADLMRLPAHRGRDVSGRAAPGCLVSLCLRGVIRDSGGPTDAGGRGGVEFRVLGPLEIEHEGRLLTLAGRRQRALMAILLLHANEVVSSDRLLDALWSEEPPASGKNALQVRVSQLRKLLRGGAEVETRAPGYRICLKPDQLDVLRFERLMSEAERSEPAIAAARLREALALWRGESLSDFAAEDFARASIARLEELRLTALERRIEADLGLGQQDVLVAELERLVAEHPLRERFQAQLMLALYRSGRQAEALAAYAACRTMLSEELGIEPSRALRDLQQAVLRQDADLLPRGALPGERTVLVVARHADRLQTLVRIGALLCRRPVKELLIAAIVPDASALNAMTERLRAERIQLLEQGVAVRTAAFVSKEPAADLTRLAADHDVDVLIIDSAAAGLDGTLTTLMNDLACDVAALAGGDLGRGLCLFPSPEASTTGRRSSWRPGLPVRAARSCGFSEWTVRRPRAEMRAGCSRASRSRSSVCWA